MPSRPGPFKLLIVDDNALSLSLLRLQLSQQGHTVTALTNPLEAIEAARNEAYDLVFTDIQMPEMSGMEASHRMRGNGFIGPIIALTAHLTDAEETRIRASGINDVLIKPISKRETDQVFRNWLTAAGGNQSPEVNPKKPTQAAPARRSADIFDTALGLERANGNPEIATEFLELLMASLPADWEMLQSAVAEPDLSALRKAVHKLHGALKFSGTARFEATIAALEAAVKSVSDVKEPTLTACLRASDHEYRVLLDWYQTTPVLFSPQQSSKGDSS